MMPTVTATAIRAPEPAVPARELSQVGIELSDPSVGQLAPSHEVPTEVPSPTQGRRVVSEVTSSSL